MTTRYRVEYALKTHRRDQLIEWIKGLLAVPFVLHSQPTAVLNHERRGSVTQMATTAHRRYAEIMHDVEELINDHISLQRSGSHDTSKLKLLVPSVGIFFTPLCLEAAFVYQDHRRYISSRRFVAPSFNDIRIVLNTAQLMSLVQGGLPDLLTFDGDVTLYDDGESLRPGNPVISRLLALLEKGIRIGIVTAAGYLDAHRYYERLHGLLDPLRESDINSENARNLVVMGGESNFLFRFDSSQDCLLSPVERDEWALEEMKNWKQEDITELLDLAEEALRETVQILGMKSQTIRKERAVGIIPEAGRKFPREQLEETVLVVQKILESSAVGKRLPFCAFNGGNDVFVDIGDKSYGVQACQRYFGGISGPKTLHVGDQFLSAGANDFKARLACTTAWIANPTETVQLLDEMDYHAERRTK